jgi:histidinol dehydrogenase
MRTSEEMNIQQIDLDEPSARLALLGLRNRLSAEGEIVSKRGQELTRLVFGEPLSPARAVERICTDVRARGLDAVLHYTAHFDNAHLSAETIQVPREELADAHASASRDFLEVIRRVRNNILAFQSGLVRADAVLAVPGGHELRVRFRPIRRVGVCVPGGAAAYPSTLLMTVCPAQAAGVPEIAVVMPPSAFGGYNPDMLATCHELGISEVYRLGGAQAVAALAYGVEAMPAVDMIVGPGNLFVTLAKKFVFGRVGIDMLAGPSEVVVLADDSARAEFVAADLIAQAEHAPGASILVTWHAPLADQVHAALERQANNLPRGEMARESLESFGALVVSRDENQAVACVNELAPEHLHIQARHPERIADAIHHAGAIFLGEFTPVALGDYVAGPSHVLPTGATARFASGLSASDFLKRTSVIAYTAKGLRMVADDVRFLALKERLTGHAASVDARLAATDESGMI